MKELDKGDKMTDKQIAAIEKVTKSAVKGFEGK